MSRNYQIKVYKSFEEFYPFYLFQHSNNVNRLLHYIGTTLVIILALYFLITLNFKFLLSMPIAGYGFAWIGHFFFEKNKPATFKYPFFSLAGDFVMYYDFLTNQTSKKLKIFGIDNIRVLNTDRI
jgi:hypothetical protein